MAVTIDTVSEADKMQVRLAGEVDVSNADEVREARAGVFAKAPRAVEVDLSEVPYIDSTGIGVLVGAAHEASDAGAAFSVTNPQHNVARVLSLLDVADKLGVRTTD